MKRILLIVGLSLMANIAIAKMNESDVIASTLWYEARGEGYRGIDAVASVIFNRAKKSGQSAASECLRRNQFSCWNGKIVARVPRDAKGRRWDYCRKVAKEIVNRKFKPIFDATHFYNPVLCMPKWGRKMRTVKWIGDTRFCK